MNMTNFCMGTLKPYCKRISVIVIKVNPSESGKKKETEDLTMNKQIKNSSRNKRETRFAGKQSGDVAAAQVISQSEAVRTEDHAFHNFFDMESIGYTIFLSSNGIRSYLSINDLIRFSITSRGMHSMCGMFTVQEFLQRKSRSLSKQHRIALGIEVMKKVTTYRQGTRTTKRPGRVLFDSTCHNHFWAKLYHPDELEEVSQIVDLHLSRHGIEHPKLTRALIEKKGKTDGYDETSHNAKLAKKRPKLIRASFHGIGERSGYDVTSHIAKLAKKHNGRLILQPPAPILNGRGIRSYEPTTFKWWYTRLFGDPCPYRRKELVITTRFPISGRIRKYRYYENQAVDLHLNSKKLDVLAENKNHKMKSN